MATFVILLYYESDICVRAFGNFFMLSQTTGVKIAIAFYRW